MIRGLFCLCLCFVSSASFAYGQDEDTSPRMSLRDFTEYHLPERDRSEAARKRLASLRKGVRVMKSRKPSDPRSWFYQAAIHGVTNEQIIAAADRDPDVTKVQREMFWNRCPHHGEPSADFLVWHRAYLFYFERILRDAADDPTLSLPYWDYTGGATSFPRAFSEQLRETGDIIPLNPLYSAEREGAFTGGRLALSAAITTQAYERIMAEKFLFGETEDTGLAGGVYDSDGGTMGLLERRPHNDLHVAIGGVIGNDHAGLMAEVTTAAFDPIFWVHHSNIDRLFAKWNASPDREWGHYPEAAWFVERPWFFNDADGSIKNNPRHYYLTGKSLGVSYSGVDQSATKLTDSLPYELQDTRALLATLPKNFQVDPETGLATMELAPMCDCCRKKGVEATLSETSATELSLNIVGSAEESRKLMSLKPLVKRPERTPQTILEVSFMAPEFLPTVGYEVFLAIKPSETEEEAKVSVGNLSFFGLSAHHSGESKEGEAEAITQSFNITKAIAKFNAQGKEVKVVIKPYPLFEGGPVAKRSESEIDITNLSIKVE